MRGAASWLMAGMLLSSSSHVWLCERDGQVSAYEIQHGADACEIRYYPPNEDPVMLRRDRECLPALIDYLSGARAGGWHCDLPVMS